jgi:hypothetical protein
MPRFTLCKITKRSWPVHIEPYAREVDWCCGLAGRAELPLFWTLDLQSA